MKWYGEKSDEWQVTSDEFNPMTIPCIKFNRRFLHKDREREKPSPWGEGLGKGGQPHHFPTRHFLWVLLLIIIFQLPVSVAKAQGASASPWNKIVVIGASASAGFVVYEPFGGTNTTNRKLRFYLDAAIAVPHPPLQDFSTALLFLNPVDGSQGQVKSALAARPTLVIGVDFLFWSCYGDGLSDDGRLRRFNDGLKLLERFKCPVVVGDIPDVSSATNTGIISAEQVPNAAVLAQVNERLHAWAARHPQVVIVPLAKFIQNVAANKTIVVHGLVFPEGKTRTLMQGDRLHPTPRGAALLALGILDALVSHEPEFPAKDIRWNQKQVFQLGFKEAQEVEIKN